MKLINKKKILAGIMLLNGFFAYIGMYISPDYSLIFLMAGFISIIYSMILSIQIIEFKRLKWLIYLIFIILILILQYNYLFCVAIGILSIALMFQW